MKTSIRNIKRNDLVEIDNKLVQIKNIQCQKDTRIVFVIGNIIKQVKTISEVPDFVLSDYLQNLFIPLMFCNNQYEKLEWNDFWNNIDENLKTKLEDTFFHNTKYNLYERYRLEYNNEYRWFNFTEMVEIQ